MCKGPERSIDAYGIICRSRYGWQSDLNVMKGIANLLVRAGMPVTEMFCDSKIGCQYMAQISVNDEKVACEVANYIGDLVVRFHPGHNGIVVKYREEVLFDLAADWLTHNAVFKQWGK